MKNTIASLLRAVAAFTPQLHRRSARFALAAGVVGALSIAGYALRPAPVMTPLTYASIHDPRQLSEMDRALYTAIFTAQERGEYETADTLMSQLDNQILLGHVLAGRYLSGSYEARADELVTWLANYSDHPEASRVAQLARRKGADAALLADFMPSAKPLKGDGYVFHLGRTTMPDGWYRGLRLWKEKNYKAAGESFAALGENEKLNDWQRSAANYWAYRSLLQQGESRAANRMLAKAADAPLTFYGMLARARQGQQPAAVSAPAVSYTLRNHEQVLRAYAFASLDMADAAEMELRNLYSKLGERERTGLVALSAEMGLANLQLRLAKLPELSEAEQAFASYPAPHEMVSAASSIIDPALVLAIARQESGFRDTAKSEAGALGMMQIMPATARIVLRQAERDSLSLADNDDAALPLSQRLNDSALSATLGATYLKMLAGEPAIGNSLMKMLAGYNAGPGAVAGWSKTARNMNDPLLYLESIPYPETHNYVLQVMTHYWIYQTMMGQQPSSLGELANGQWPTIG